MWDFNMAHYYIFVPPTVLPAPPVNYPLGPHCKPGITESWPDGRLGKYQLPYGPYWEASYAWICSHSDLKTIKWIESSVLGHFRHRCVGLGAGMTEWLENTTWQEVRDYVLLICKDTGIQITDYGQGPWNPVRIQQEIIK
jgi:hypothetical protein